MAYHSVFWVKQSDRLTWATDSLNQHPMGVLQISSQTGMIEWGQKSKPQKTFELQTKPPQKSLDKISPPKNPMPNFRAIKISRKH